MGILAARLSTGGVAVGGEARVLKSGLLDASALVLDIVRGNLPERSDKLQNSGRHIVWGTVR